MKPMFFTSPSTSLKSGNAVPDQFPAGLRVLVVDDDPTCLSILEKLLRKCHYEVTICNRAEIALKLLRDNRDSYDVVISDVHMPDMDGFKLLEHVGLEMDLPVIMMSADDCTSVVIKGVTRGACDYLIKPVRVEALKNIWQHVVRKRDFGQLGSAENEDNRTNSKKRKDEKPRMVWSVELHQQFLTYVNQLGINRVVPRKILELMNVPGLTRENIARHLQIVAEVSPISSKAKWLLFNGTGRSGIWLNAFSQCKS